MEGAPAQECAPVTWDGLAPDVTKVFIRTLANYYIKAITHVSAVCTPSCVNGRCTGPNTCSCNSGWGGDVCDARKHKIVYIFETVTTPHDKHGTAVNGLL